jgi:endonuclease/exonuclease/phosphatase family metal-dependent hydrolase
VHRLLNVVSLLVVLLAGAAACARAPRVPDLATAPVCRGVVSLRESPPETVVAWITPRDERTRARLADWCAMVGPVVYEREPARTPNRPMDRLAIVSWNTHVGGGDLGALVDAVQRGDFTRGEPVDAVVLLLQEMYRHGSDVPARATILSAVPSRIAHALHAEHTRDVRRVASERGLALLYTPSMRNGALADDPEDRGNAILSTLPLSDPAAVELPIERQRRVAAVATVGGQTTTGAAWRVRLANVHLDTALALFHGGPLTARKRQVDALVAALTESLPFPGPTVLAGDFNAWLGEREPAIRALRGAFPDAPALAGSTWAGPLGLRATLDYVFAKGPVGTIQVQRVPSRFGSDHYPLLSVVRF